MKEANVKELAVWSFALWLAAVLVYPVAHWIPAGAGPLPKILDVLVPVFMPELAVESDSFLKKAQEKEREE